MNFIQNTPHGLHNPRLFGKPIGLQHKPHTTKTNGICQQSDCRTNLKCQIHPYDHATVNRGKMNVFNIWAVVEDVSI